MLHGPEKSVGWFKGKITGHSHISWENLWFPVQIFPYVNPLEKQHPRATLFRLAWEGFGVGLGALGALCLGELMKHESIGEEGEFQHFVAMVLYDFSMVVCVYIYIYMCV